MKKVIYFFFVSCFYLAAQGQYLAQSADGKGAIPLPLSGIGLGFDIGKSEITFGLNNYDKALTSKDNKNNWFLGLNLSVKNSDGLGSLFSTGDISPSGDFLGFAGYTFSNNEELLRKWHQSAFVTTKKAEVISGRLFFESYKSDVLNAVGLSIGKIADANERSTIQDSLVNKINRSGDKIAIDLRIGELKLTFPQPRYKDFWTQLDDLVTVAKNKYIQTYNAAFTNETAKADARAFDSTIKTLKAMRITPFILGGISARTFTVFSGINPGISFSNSFKDTLFRGGTFGVGFNAQYKNLWLGATYSYLDGDNFVSLSSKDYTLQTRDTSGNQILLQEKKKTAYSGKYGKVATNQLNIDLVWDVKINDSSRLLASAYLRSSLFSRDTSLLKNYVNLGIGLYFLGRKSKFLGGLYVELPDINNNIEKAKAPTQQDIRPPLKKLTFGITTKFSFSSILSMTNRPRKPDTAN